MDCALWLNRHKVFSADEIPDNFDLAALRGYFLAGSLVEWLREHNGIAYADRLENVAASSPTLNDTLTELFGGRCSCKTIELCGTASDTDRISGGPAASSYGGSFFGSYHGSFGSYSGLWELFLSGAFGSFSLGSFRKGSFSEWEWEWEWLFRHGVLGSYSFGSFARGSFFGGSFPVGSFGSSSFCGLYNGIPLDGLDEYDRIMLASLVCCPLNRFGYGIHNI